MKKKSLFLILKLPPRLMFILTCEGLAQICFYWDLQRNIVIRYLNCIYYPIIDSSFPDRFKCCITSPTPSSTYVLLSITLFICSFNFSTPFPSLDLWGLPGIYSCTSPGGPVVSSLPRRWGYRWKTGPFILWLGYPL